jgi:hypothetical protein
LLPLSLCCLGMGFPVPVTHSDGYLTGNEQSAAPVKSARCLVTNPGDKTGLFENSQAGFGCKRQPSLRSRQCFLIPASGSPIHF